MKRVPDGPSVRPAALAFPPLCGKVRPPIQPAADLTASTPAKPPSSQPIAPPGTAAEGETNVPRASVVVVSFHTGPVLFDALRAVLAQTVPVEIIVVNNGNPADVEAGLAQLASAHAHVRLVSGQGNVGFGAGSNLGCRYARSPVMLFLNPDSLIGPDCLERSLDVLATLPRHSMVGGDLRNPDGSPQRGARRMLPTPWASFIELFRVYKLAPSHPYFARVNRHHDDLPADTEAVPAISGAFMAMHKGDFCAIGGFDEAYFHHVEDLDFCLRWQTAGHLTWFTPEVRITHEKSTSAVSPSFVEWHKTVGLYRYFTRHFRQFYPAGFMQVVGVGLFARFAAGCVMRSIARLFGQRAGSFNAAKPYH